MGKYQPLGDFLRAKRAQEVALTFDEIERITGVKLPPKAQHQRAWWSNNPSNNVMTKVWLAAGFETTRVDLANRKLVFRRVRTAAPAGTTVIAASTTADHPLRGLLKEVTLIPAGVDLTEPACPEWADLADAKYGREPTRAK